MTTFLYLATTLVLGFLVGILTDMITGLVGWIISGKPILGNLTIVGVMVGMSVARAATDGGNPTFFVSLGFALVGSFGTMLYHLLRDLLRELI